MKIGIIGHFGGNEDFFDGQTIKTKNLMELLEQQENISVRRADTFYYKKNNIKLLIDSLLCIALCKHIILMVSVNGMKVFLPLLYYVKKFTRKHIYHYVIGSELLGMVSQDRKLVKYLNAFDTNWFEYESGTQYLRRQGVTNVSTMPNFKAITPIPQAEVYVPKNGIYYFCTFSRVMKEKGIIDAVNAINKMNVLNGDKVAHLDIYGPVDLEFVEEFERLLKMNSDCATYKGIVDSLQSVEVLKDYYALLFPTRWPGEGLPGTIIDAFAAGLPIIASDWNANKEIVQNMKQGIIYPNDELKTLDESVMWALHNKSKMLQMRIESRKEFVKYMPESIWNMISRELKK